MARYLYQPSEAVAGVACGLYSVGLIITVFRIFRQKAWIWFIMALGIGMEAAGYGARIASAADTTARTVYIVQFCLIILAPVLMAGVIYLVFGRIVFHVVPAEARTFRLLWVPARWVTPIFVGFDIVALLTQVIGAIMLTATEPTDPDAAAKINRGKNIAMVGVIIQLVAFGLFTVVAARFHFTSRRFTDDFKQRLQAVPGDKYVTLGGNARKFNPNWRRLLYTVNISCAMILIRSIYREIDFAEGKTGYTQRYEYLLVLALPQVLVTY
ncbi:RTA1-domain-containing protein [Coniochaeta ligniaria NRRL 30616]|uniref:RTA1-domain-containing protein n=1 Tax=Coniochaeta ligniaria NRRL 30616 TaxID=1408157 RepID=A0A1J7JIN5_9PEZI|nr:RTA1-domain-containing protein [Coniochaeta ligniaria NRRL 30616]